MNHKLSNVSPNLAGQAGMAALSAVQSFSPEQQMAGLTMAFAALLQKTNTDYPDALLVARNLYKMSAHEHPEIRAIAKYVNGEF